jgi:hypothetical protein
MPAGPAAGRVEAQRRALTTPSTAPASESRWCDAWIWVFEQDASAGNTCVVPEQISTDLCSVSGRYSSCESRTEKVHAGGAFLLHDLRAETATGDTTNDGVNDPVSMARGHSQGRTPGSFTPSLVHRLRH